PEQMLRAGPPTSQQDVVLAVRAGQEGLARRYAQSSNRWSSPRTTPGGVGQVAGRAMLLVSQRERGTDETVLPEDHQQIMDVVRRADTPVMAKQVCGELGMSGRYFEGRN
ncbi:hypothetical protein ACFV27_42570, partial [Streptomyces antimycoticus]